MQWAAITNNTFTILLKTVYCEGYEKRVVHAQH